MRVATFARYVVAIVPDAIWLTMSCGNVISRLVEKPRLVTWKSHVLSHENAMSRYVEIIFSMGNFGILHAKYRIATHVQVCRNEVIIEWYCSYLEISSLVPALQ